MTHPIQVRPALPARQRRLAWLAAASTASGCNLTDPMPERSDGEDE